MIVQRTAAPTGSVPPDRHAARPFIPRMIRTFAVPIILGWLVTIAVLNVTVPQLETVGQIQAVSMSPDAAPSMISMKHIGKVFEEGDSDSAAMIVLEGQRPLGDAAHAFYDQMIGRLQADTTHVQSLQDFWGDPLTATGAQSSDGKAAYVQVKLAGNQGESLANESVEAVKTIVERLAPPPGVKVYVTGSAALVADQQQAGDRSLQVIEAVTFTVIIVMLLLVYRSIITSAIMLTMVVLGLLATRGGVAFLGFHRIIGLSTFATNLLVVLAIAAATDYAIFLIGRYQEARGLGQDRESAYYTMFGGTAHVVLGSGLTIAGATFCLSFTRLPYFQTLGVPLAIGMLIVVAAALTLGPAIIAVTSRFGKLLLMIAGISALCLIFIIMLITTRSVVAAAVIVGTVVLSLGASFGLSVLIWQHILGIELHWLVLAMAVIILLAVGADYNLLLVARLKEEIHAGINTGIIRAMGGSGSVVTAAGLVFAFTMMSFAVSELTVMAQVGTTIGMGLLFDTLIVRSFMTPSIAALLGKWFWWPQVVRQRPVPQPWPSPASARTFALV